MRKISLIIASLVLVGFVGGVLAQETELPDPGLTPDSPFYFLEIIVEEIGTFFTFGDLKKAERHAVLAAERLAEAQVIAGKGKPKLTEKTLARYENQLEKSMTRVERAESKGENTEKVMEVLARVGQATSKHLEVLAEVYEKVPEEAKPAIENAMKVSVKGHEKAVEALKAQNALGEIPEEAALPVQVPQKVRERVRMRVQQELEAEKAERAKENDLQSFESFGAFCIEQGTPPEVCASLVNDLQNSESLKAFFCTEKEALPPEMCEKIPLQGFESFEQIEDFCIEMGGTPELCSSVEGRCREVGVTTPDECFLVLLTATTTSSPAPTLSEEEMEEGTTTKPRIEEGTTGISTEELECAFNEMIFYYREGCGWCQKVKDDGIIEGIEELGVKVNQVDTTIGPIQHQFSGVPTFVIDEKVYVGYKTFEQIKDLLGCQ